MAQTCSVNQDDPKSCKVGVASSDVRKGSLGQVGDPVDLSTAALSLDPLDVDLGHGFRFSRHYTSATTPQTTMGKAWSHSLDWQLTRTTAGSFQVLLIKEPLRPLVPFVSNGTAYSANLMDEGSVTVDGSGVVHYTSGTRVEADFDAQNRLVALRYPDELAISVTYGANSVTYSNGNQTLALSFYPTGHANAGLVSSVSAGGEIWSYSYNSSQYLTTVVGPDPSRWRQSGIPQSVRRQDFWRA